VTRKCVLNASPLITLGKISQIGLLEAVCSDLIIPEGVVHEIDQGAVDDPPASLLFGYNQDFLLSNIKRMIEVQLIAINAARLSATGSSPLSEQKTVHGRGGGNYLLGMST